MTQLLFKSMPTSEARHFQSDGTDANGQSPERAVSDGDGVPCRHCLEDVGQGEDYLVLAYRPFPSRQPYAETGPIFLHAGPCERAADTPHIPPMLAKRKAHLIKGYGTNDRIVYGTGQVVPSDELETAAAEILARPDVAYVHVRSAVNNCYTCRIDRAT
ncbi:MAG: DUF1203 domain-containing protein [Rhizobiales bacterium]|nr:DUF1203 domain-containing protein [Hyphomicrobiales bacterium]